MALEFKLADDPFTEVLMKIWVLLEENNNINTLVKTGNRIKLHTSSGKPDKDRHTKTDVPELVIAPAGGEGQRIIDSDTWIVTQRFGVGLTSGDLRVNEIFFPLKWALVKAFASANERRLDLSYVQQVTLEDFVDEPDVETHPGWQTGLDIVVIMQFNRYDLKTQ